MEGINFGYIRDLHGDSGYDCRKRGISHGATRSGGDDQRSPMDFEHLCLDVGD